MTAPLLVTGGTGLLGRAVLRRAEGLELVALSRSAPPGWARELPNVEWVTADLAAHDLGRLLPERLAGIVHLARSRRQKQGADGALDVFEVNVGSTARLLEHAARAGAERFVLASSASVYRRSDEPLAEDAPLDCSSLYEASKLSAELLVQAYAERVPGIALRIFTPYGEGQTVDLMAELVERVRAGRPIDVQGEHGLLLSPIHADDVAEAVLAALRLSEAELGGAVNVGGPDRLGIAEVGSLIGGTLGIEPRFERHGGPDPLGYLADRRRAMELLDAPDPAAFAEGIARTLA